MSYLKTHFFVGNRAALRDKIGADGPIIVAGHGRVQRSADTTYPFTQSRNFWYLTGLDDPDLVLAIDDAGSYIILPPADAVRDLFDGAVDVMAAKRRSGVDEVLPYKEGWNRLKSSLQAAKQIHTELVGALYNSHHGLYTNPAKKRVYEKILRATNKATFSDVRPHLHQLRSIKQNGEIDALRQATQITSETLNELRGGEGLAKYATEYELEAAIGEGFRRRGSTGHAYTPIVASGPHATTLHYVSNAGTLGSGELIVLDVGAELENYAADVTRTVSKSKPSTRQKQVYDAVYEVQQAAQALLQPGTMLRDYEESVCHAIGSQLVKLGLATNAKDMGVIRRYYPHATSHFLGLDVHDVGDYNQPLAAGMVLTCEPGLYIPDEGIGVRIEDDILITADGSENLTANCSYKVFDI